VFLSPQDVYTYVWGAKRVARQATPSIYSPHNNSNRYTLEADSVGAPDSLSDDPNGQIPMARLNWPLAISGIG
jgi:hypothetical protein